MTREETPMTTQLRNAIIHTGPWILYDGRCGLCTRGVARLGPIVQRRGFRLTPLQSLIGRAFDTGKDEMQLITASGTVLGGMDAYAYICRHIWWATPLFVLWHLPVSHQLLRWMYRKLATNRYRISDACKLSVPREDNPYAMEL